ncbi:MAG: DUF255 domain-containing protein [Armatimonadetes bacterium]|nr:DUF255 domain-containing protein [Armatimonadota bacterium]
MANRLASETSPYLRQHLDDPVHWHAWGKEALDKALAEDKPIFLSIGYSACHWCHVMAHECFQDQEIADALNQYFISIKVDREERPDVDEVYMAAVQMATGHGGWPISVFLTPSKAPFYAGTYFPKEARGDYPGFRTVVSSLGQSWESQKEQVRKTAEKFGEALRSAFSKPAGRLAQAMEYTQLDACVSQLHDSFDFEHGGYGDRPKFPPHTTIQFLIEYAAQRHVFGGDASTIDDLSGRAGHMALFTLEKIALGGIHDHVGGGFHRYSVDENWGLPHFEKMLTDNALLLHQFAAAEKSTGDERLASLFHRTIDGTMRWIEGSMTSPEGLFYSSVDADSDGGEGLFYTWTADEIADVLGERAATFCDAYDVSAEGNFDDEATREPSGRNVLRLGQDQGDAFADDLRKLAEARSSRPEPGVDDKCLAGWNGMMIGAAAVTGRLELAERAATAWLDLIQSGRLPRQFCKGKPSGLGFLDDYASMANGLLDLHDATGNERWQSAASELVDEMCALFRDEDRGGFFLTSNEHEELFGRMRPVTDGSTPSASAEAGRVLWRLGRSDETRELLSACAGWMQRLPTATTSLQSLALDYMLEHRDGVAVSGSAPPSIDVRIEPAEIEADEQGWGHAEVVIDLPDGWHINTDDPPANWLTPTSLHVEGVLGEASFPDGENDQLKGQVRIALRLRTTSPKADFEVQLRFQPCTDSECLEPMERVLSGVLKKP